MQYPYSRLRRNRKAKWCRELLSETSITPANIIQPLFIIEGKNLKVPVPSMPGVNRVSCDVAVEIAKQAYDLGIGLLALFPVIDLSLKSDDGREAYNQNNLICRIIAEIKKHMPHIGIMGDVALDPYTTHGHDGIIVKDDVHNDLTVEALVKQALTLAGSGCDIVAPSDMMDGRVGKIREALEGHEFHNTQIMSYSVKYASSLYGPFREAVGSKPANGRYINKSTYQLDYHNCDEAMREIQQDIDEGADFIIIKPGMLYLDVINRASWEFNIPIIAYQVSGEYSVLKAAALQGYLNYEKALLESLVAFRRAGDAGIITYAGLEIAAIL